MLAHVAGLAGAAAAGTVVVVRAPGQELPGLPAGVRAAEDAREGRGPLEGLRAGLRALEPEVEAAYVAAVDLPFLTPGRWAGLGALVEGAQAAVPRAGGRAHPFAAAYRPAVLPVVDALLAEGRARMGDLLSASRWHGSRRTRGSCGNQHPLDYARARRPRSRRSRSARE